MELLMQVEPEILDKYFLGFCMEFNIVREDEERELAHLILSGQPREGTCQSVCHLGTSRTKCPAFKGEFCKCHGSDKHGRPNFNAIYQRMRRVLDNTSRSNGIKSLLFEKRIDHFRNFIYSRAKKEYAFGTKSEKLRSLEEPSCVPEGLITIRDLQLDPWVQYVNKKQKEGRS